MLPFLLVYSLRTYYMMQPFPEAELISQTFRANFDKVLCDSLEKYRSCPGFSLLLGSITQYTNLRRHPLLVPPGMVAYLYLDHQQGQGHILDDTGLSGIYTPTIETSGTEEFLTYFIELLENPERSETNAFDQHGYVIAAKECLELCLCSHHKFTKGAMTPTRHDKVLLREQPWAWKLRLGIHSRIQKAIRQLTVQRWKSLKAWTHDIDQYPSFPHNSFMDEYYRFLSYQWRLDLLPIFLGKSAISLELANVLRTRTFTTMAQRFPRRMRLAREAIMTYLLRVDSVGCGP